MKKLGMPPLHIDGWLVLVAIRLILGGFNSLGALGQLLNTRTDPDIRPLHIIGVVFIILVIVYFFKRWRHFKKAYIVLELYVILYNLFIAVTFDSYPAFFVYLIAGALWILYMILSRRVKMTFVYNWDKTLNEESMSIATGLNTAGEIDAAAGQEGESSATASETAPLGENTSGAVENAAAVQKKPFYKKAWFWIVIGCFALVVAGILIMYTSWITALNLLTYSKTEAVNSAVSSIAETDPPDVPITAEEFKDSFNSLDYPKEKGHTINKITLLDDSEFRKLLIGNGLTDNGGKVFDAYISKDCEIAGFLYGDSNIHSMVFNGVCDYTKEDDPGLMLAICFLEASNPGIQDEDIATLFTQEKVEPVELKGVVYTATYMTFEDGTNQYKIIARYSD